MLPSTEPPVTSIAPRVTTVFVKVKREADLGYPDFMKVARQFIKRKQPIPFGMRDASRASFEISLTAEVGDGDADAVIADLTTKAQAIADRELRTQYIGTFQQAEKAELPEDAFVIQSTTVERIVAEEF